MTHFWWLLCDLDLWPIDCLRMYTVRMWFYTWNFRGYNNGWHHKMTFESWNWSFHTHGISPIISWFSSNWSQQNDLRGNDAIYTVWYSSCPSPIVIRSRFILDSLKNAYSIVRIFYHLKWNPLLLKWSNVTCLWLLFWWQLESGDTCVIFVTFDNFRFDWKWY